jgi:hypothetical protein
MSEQKQENSRGRLARYEADRERELARSREWYAANRERKIAYCRDHYAANKEDIQTKRRERYAENRAELLLQKSLMEAKVELKTFGFDFF